MLKPRRGTLTAEALLDKAKQINLHGGVKMVRIETSPMWNGQRENWIVIRSGYLLSTRGWRRYQGEPGFYDEVTPDEFRYHPRQLLFPTALDAADFYYSNCLGQGTGAAFDLKIVELRDHIGNEFPGEDWDAVVKAACSIKATLVGGAQDALDGQACIRTNIFSVPGNRPCGRRQDMSSC